MPTLNKSKTLTAKTTPVNHAKKFYPANARIGVERARKIIFPVMAEISAEYGNHGNVNAIPISATQDHWNIRRDLVVDAVTK